MLDIILAVLLIAIPSIVILVALFLGIKRNIFQSLAKLVMTILSITISAVIVKTVTPAVASDLLGIILPSNDTVLGYFKVFTMAGDVLKLLSAFVIPAVFAIVFLVINFIFDLLYFIPGRLLSDKAFARRASKLVADAAPEADYVTQQPENTAIEEVSEKVAEEISKKKFNWQKIGLRTGAILCNLLAAILVLSMLAVPINAYSRIASSTLSEPDGGIELSADIDEIIAVVDAVETYPTNRFYSVFNGLVVTYFDQFTALDGTKVIASNTLSDVISLVSYVSTSDLSEINSDVLLNFADHIGRNNFIKNIATELVSDLCNAWIKGETLLGIAAPEFEGDLLNILLTKLSDCDDITVAIRAAANALKLQQAITPDNINGAGDTASMITQIFADIDSDTADMVKAFVSNEVLTEIASMPPAMAENISGFVGNVLDGIIAIKDDADLSSEEQEALLKKEATAMASILDMAKAPETIAPEKMVESIVSSNVIADTIQDITGDGSAKDPYGIANAITDDFVDSVSGELNKQGVDSNSDLYKSIMAMIQK